MTVVEMSVAGQGATEPPAVDTPELADALCVRVMDAAAGLVEVLERETALLRRGRAQELGTLYAHKAALSASLTREMGRLRDNADYIRQTAPHRIAALTEMQGQFRRSLETNHDTLSAMKAVSEQLLQTIAAKANEQRGVPETYGKGAHMEVARPARPTAIRINTVL